MQAYTTRAHGTQAHAHAGHMHTDMQVHAQAYTHTHTATYTHDTPLLQGSRVPLTAMAVRAIIYSAATAGQRAGCIPRIDLCSVFVHALQARPTSSTVFLCCTRCLPTGSDHKSDPFDCWGVVLGLETGCPEFEQGEVLSTEFATIR
jgi:hypothetical protein